MNSWLRALRRVKAPLAYSQGFHPHPKLAFSTASPVGEESIGDYMDISLERRVEPAELMLALRETLPEGFDVLSAREVPMRKVTHGPCRGSSLPLLLPNSYGS